MSYWMYFTITVSFVITIYHHGIHYPITVSI